MQEQYLSHKRSLSELDFMSERLMEVLHDSESEEVIAKDPHRIDEAVELLGRSNLEIEHLDNLEVHEVKDYHVWSVKHPQLQQELVKQLFSDRDQLQMATDQLEKVVDQMHGLRERVVGIRLAYLEHIAGLQAEADKMSALGLGADHSQDTVEQMVLPELDRLLHKLDLTLEMFEKELQGRLDRLDYLGKQIALLRGGQSPIRKQRTDDKEPPKDDETTEEQPTQAEALVDHQDEQLGEYDTDDLDRGRSDERQKKKKKRGSRSNKK